MWRDRQAHRQAPSAPTRPSGLAQVSAVIERRITSAAQVGALVREARLAAGMTQQQLADLAGTTRQWVNRLEMGHSTAAFSKTLAALAVLGLEMVAQLERPRPAPPVDLDLGSRR